MDTAREVAVAGGGVPPATVVVWDRFVRFFHWSLVTLFAVGYLTGGEAEDVHIVNGYVLASLLALRVLWGFVGPRTARFRSFVRSPAGTLAYVRDAARLRARRYLGHNPAGAAMILALLLALAGTVTTGIMMTTDAWWGSEWVEEVHEFLANATVGLIILHVAGVLVASFQHRENLAAAMVTGRKRAE
ncbi:MAG: cytochrome b/b6 domain-containing protein [Steroidobacteraceae bacterium]